MIEKYNVATLTPEQRAEMLEKARLSRELKKANSANIVVSLDDKYWRETASSLGVRMPPAVAQSHELKWLKRACNKLNIDVNYWTKEIVGAKSLKEVADMNPNIGAVGIFGLVLEAYVNGMFEELPE